MRGVFVAFSGARRAWIRIECRRQQRHGRFVRHHNGVERSVGRASPGDWRIGEGGEGRLGGMLAAYEMCASEALEAFDRATGNPGVWVNSTEIWRRASVNGWNWSPSVRRRRRRSENRVGMS